LIARLAEACVGMPGTQILGLTQMRGIMAAKCQHWRFIDSSRDGIKIGDIARDMHSTLVVGTVTVLNELFWRSFVAEFSHC